MAILLLRTDKNFPSALRDLKNWPDRLYVRGQMQPELPLIAMVGARAASGASMRLASDMAGKLVSAGYGIVSGGALGIDSAAHRGALLAGGYTVSVMAGGLDRLYPDRNRSLFAAIVASGGALVSPFDEGCPPIRNNFVARNRIVAAMAELVVVVEAEPRSGSLHTARFAAGLGRKLAALPHSPGCQALIVRGAYPVESGEQIVELLAGSYVRPGLAMPAADSPEAAILACLHTEKPNDAQAITEQTSQSLRLVQRSLLALEMRGLVVALPGHRYLRSALAP